MVVVVAVVAVRVAVAVPAAAMTVGCTWKMRRRLVNCVDLHCRMRSIRNSIQRTSINFRLFIFLCFTISTYYFPYFDALQFRSAANTFMAGIWSFDLQRGWILCETDKCNFDMNNYCISFAVFMGQWCTSWGRDPKDFIGGRRRRNFDIYIR